jgi:hypothetical protein
MKNQKMNPANFIFSNPVILSRASVFDVTYEEITQVHMVRLQVMPMAWLVMWHHIAVSHATACGVTKSCRLLWRDWWPVTL